MKFTNTLLTALWNLRRQNFIIFSLVSHIVLVTMKWQMFQHAWLPLTNINYTAIQTQKS